MLYLNFVHDGCLLEHEPQGLAIEIKLDPRSEETILHLLALESFNVSDSLAALVIASRRLSAPQREAR